MEYEGWIIVDSDGLAYLGTCRDRRVGSICAFLNVPYLTKKGRIVLSAKTKRVWRSYHNFRCVKASITCSWGKE